jgi:hypothetical protein
MFIAVLTKIGRRVWNTLVAIGEARGARAVANAKRGIYLD